MLGWLFGGSKAADKTVDSLSNGIDKMFYTDEEKADGRQKGFDSFIKWQEATQPQNLARRLIALIVTALFSVLVLVCVVAGYFDQEGYSAYVYELTKELVFPAFLVIISFYFGKGIVSDIAKARKP